MAFKPVQHQVRLFLVSVDQAALNWTCCSVQCELAVAILNSPVEGSGSLTSVSRHAAAAALP